MSNALEIVVEFTNEEYGLIQSSLDYTKLAFENYQQYPSYEFKQGRVKEVSDLKRKLSEARRKAKNGLS